MRRLDWLVLVGLCMTCLGCAEQSQPTPKPDTSKFGPRIPPKTPEPSSGQAAN